MALFMLLLPLTISGLPKPICAESTNRWAADFVLCYEHPHGAINSVATVSAPFTIKCYQ